MYRPVCAVRGHYIPGCGLDAVAALSRPIDSIAHLLTLVFCRGGGSARPRGDLFEEQKPDYLK